MRGLIGVLALGLAIPLAGSFNNLAAQEKAPTTVVLKAAPLGGVIFTHAAHEKMTKCVSCHHASMPAKPLKSAHQKCGDCHTKPVQPPMKTSIRDAYHDAMAKKGICMDCHIKEAAAGKVVPVKCGECHKKTNN